LIQSLLSDVILAEDTDLPPDSSSSEGAELPPGVSRSEGQVGGRDVVTLETGDIKQHVFASGDTVWVVTDHAGEEEMTAEAIAALP
jgi:hypothetical protein